MKTIEWLFERLGPEWIGQHGWARADKSALLWAPSRSRFLRSADIARADDRAVFRGATQVAWKRMLAPMDMQTHCCVAWVGLDIDAHDNPAGIDDDLICQLIPQASVRSSCSGRGRHVLLRLGLPVICHQNEASGLIRHLTAPYVTMLEAVGIRVCKADRRMFWLEGGENRWIRQTQELLANRTPEPSTAAASRLPTVAGTGELQVAMAHPDIRVWLGRFVAAGLLADPVPAHARVYVGWFIELLRAHGERIDTVSGRSGDGRVNGYLDVTETSLNLWSYAEGRSIWRCSAIDL